MRRTNTEESEEVVMLRALGWDKDSLKFALEIYLSGNPMMLTDFEKAELRKEWDSYQEDKYVS